MAKVARTDALAAIPWKSALGVYQEGAIEIIAKGLRINAAKLREPENLYEADFAWVRLRNGAVSLFFGKEDLNNEKQLRTRLEIRYPIERFLGHFWKTSRDFHAKMREMPDWPVDPRRATIAPESMRAERDHSQRANLNYMARSGSEAVLDFYYLGPGGVARLAQGQGAGGLHVDPVARVQTSTSELARLLNEVEPLVDGLTAQLPEALREATREDSDDDDSD